jgi:hypothetical protein
MVSSLALVACATAPPPVVTEPTTPQVASYDLDAHAMVPIVYAATHAEHYRVAVIEPAEYSARFVMVAKDGRAPLVVHVQAKAESSYQFATCLGMCSTQIAVTSPSGADDQARRLSAAIAVRAQAARMDH